MNSFAAATHVDAQSLRPLLAVVSPSGATLRLRGEISGRDMQALQARVAELAVLGHRRITLDLAAVTHWDYRSLPPLARLAARLKREGAALSLRAANRYLTTILRFGGLDRLLEEGSGA